MVLIFTIDIVKLFAAQNWSKVRRPGVLASPTDHWLSLRWKERQMSNGSLRSRGIPNTTCPKVRFTNHPGRGWRVDHLHEQRSVLCWWCQPGLQVGWLASCVCDKCFRCDIDCKASYMSTVTCIVDNFYCREYDDGEHRCACRQNLKWNKEEKECQVFTQTFELLYVWEKNVIMMD